MRSNLRHFVKIAVVTAGISYFAGGFALGVVRCKPNGDVFETLVGGFFAGLLYCSMSAVSFGFPPGDFESGAPINAWPMIAVSWLALFSGCAVYDRLRDKKKLQRDPRHQQGRMPSGGNNFLEQDRHVLRHQPTTTDDRSIPRHGAAGRAGQGDDDGVQHLWPGGGED